MARDPVLLRDVADRAGVTVSTASRALRRPEMVRAETRARVEAAAQELGYTPNRMAQAIATGRSRMLVFVVPDLTNPMFSILARAALAEARERAFDVLVVDSMFDTQREAELVEQAQHYAEGIIVCMPRGSYPPDADDPPVVAINRRMRGAHAVLVDQAAVIEAQVDHLRSLGHERIVYIDGPQPYWASSERHRHAKRLARDVPLEILGPMEPTFRGGCEAVDLIDPSVTGVIAFTDTQAAGVIMRLHEIGRHVPTDVSVVGSNDIPMAHMYNPPLTTMRMPFDAMGRAAVSLLLDSVDGTTGTILNMSMSSELVVRGSTAAVHA